MVVMVEVQGYVDYQYVLGKGCYQVYMQQQLVDQGYWYCQCVDYYYLVQVVMMGVFGVELVFNGGCERFD